MAVTVALSIPIHVWRTGAYQRREVAPPTPALEPGDYLWHPEPAPANLVVILVSLPDQLLYVYRDAVRIGRTGNRRQTR